MSARLPDRQTRKPAVSVTAIRRNQFKSRDDVRCECGNGDSWRLTWLPSVSSAEVTPSRK